MPSLFKKVVFSQIRLVALAIALLSFAGFFGEYQRELDLAGHFRPLYFIGLLLCLGGFMIFRHWPGIVLCLVFLLINGWFLWPYYGGNPVSQGNSAELQKIRILHINVLKVNRDFKRVAALISETQPDLLSLQEVDDAWHQALAPVLAEYPYQKTVPADDNFGIGLYSKIPLNEIEILQFGDAYSNRHFPSLFARSKAGDFSLLVTHPLPPLGGFQVRNSQLRDMAKASRHWGPNVMIIGDLNVSPGSVHFQKLLAQTGLRDTQQGFGIQPSFPSFAGIPFLAIDHVLVSPNIVVLDRKIGPNVGSDHLPVLVELGLPKTTAKAQEPYNGSAENTGAR